jgi:hypothetical protein
METLLENEVCVLTLTPRNRNLIPESEMEDEIENYEEWEYANPAEYGRLYDRRLPECGEKIVDYRDYDFYEACSRMSEDEGDTDDLDFDDLDEYLNSIGDSLRYYDSVREVARRTAEWKIQSELESCQEEILMYYAIWYYMDNISSAIIPLDLITRIEDYDYCQIDRVDDVDDMINEWIDDHEGLREYLEEQ